MRCLRVSQDKARELTVEHVQTKREIQTLLDSAGIRPRKRFGQHFLIDGNLMRMLVGSAELRQEDRVLEVGPGTGGLTDLLVKSVGELLCVEVDRDLQELLAERFAAARHVKLVRGDILESKHRLRADVEAWLLEGGAQTGGETKLVANLPYQVATPLIMNLLVDYPEVRRLCFTVQAEMGDRILAEAGTRDYGPISIVVALLTNAGIVSRLPPGVFWPAPAVDSVMLRLDLREPSPIPVAQRSAFAVFLRSVFDHRRKTLRSALGYVVDDAERELICTRVDSLRRPEAVPPAEWLYIFSLLENDALEAPK